LIRLYIKLPLIAYKDISLSESQSHYLQKVMRLKEGDEVLVFNGTHGEWLAKITATFKKSTTLTPLSQTRSPQKEVDLWLLFSPLKPKRQEFLEEKATELGVARLWPIRCERTSVLKINVEKMEAHAIEAAEQCKRLTVPMINPLTPLVDVLKAWPEDRVLIFGDETLAAPSLVTLEIDPQQTYAFLVGPEGGFSPQELALLRSHPKAQGVSLNPHILRAETAALVGLSYLQLKFGF